MQQEEVKESSSFTKGLIFSIITGLIVSSNGAANKSMKNISPLLLVAYMYWAIVSFSLPWAIFSGENVLGPRNYRVILAVRSVFIVTSTLLRYIAIYYLPLGEAIVLSNCSPIFVSVAARIFLKESLKLIHVFSVIIAIIGIILITGVYEVFILGSRAYATDDIYGIIAALSSIVAETGRYIITRKTRNVNSSVLIFNSGVISLVLLIIAVACTGKISPHYKGLQQYLIILCGLLGYAGQVTQIFALKFMEAGPMTTIKSSSLIFSSFLLQSYIFCDTPDEIKIMGAILVGSSIVFISLTNGLIHCSVTNVHQRFERINNIECTYVNDHFLCVKE